MRKDKVVAEVLGDETAITPSDLYHTEFKSAVVGGYDKDEVDSFLERVADATEVIAIDEGHFYDDRLPAVCARLAAAGKRVIVTALDLAGIPLHADERTDEHPLVIAGGHAGR